MKTWVWLLVAAVGSYFVYAAWFRPDDEDDSTQTPPVLEVPQEPELPAGTSDASSDPVAASARLTERRIDLTPGEGGVAASAPAREAAALDRARLDAERSGNTERARALAQRILANHPETDAARWIHYERGRDALTRYRAVGRNKEGMAHAREAWKHLTPVLFLEQSDPEAKRVLKEELGKLAHDLLFRGRHIEGIDRLYTPRSGDNLSTLRRKVFSGWGAKSSEGFIAHVNGLSSPKALRAGEVIRVPLGEPSIIVRKREFRLYFLLDGCYVRDFPIGLGREGSTPEANFVIEKKIKEPDWYPKPGVKIPYGDSRNILGTRWMAFRNSPDYRGFGIHGTVHPSSIGKEGVVGLRAHGARGGRVAVQLDPPKAPPSTSGDSDRSRGESGGHSVRYAHGASRPRVVRSFFPDTLGQSLVTRAMTAGGTPMSTTATRPTSSGPWSCSNPTFGATIVAVSVARTATPCTAPVFASSPDGTSTASTSLDASLIAMIASR